MDNVIIRGGFQVASCQVGVCRVLPQLLKKAPVTLAPMGEVIFIVIGTYKKCWEYCSKKHSYEKSDQSFSNDHLFSFSIFIIHCFFKLDFFRTLPSRSYLPILSCSRVISRIRPVKTIRPKL